MNAATCNFASIHAGDLRKHLKTPSGEKSFKCNQCDFLIIQAGDFRKHLKTPLGEKAYKCNQCDFASVQAGNLRTHLKTHSGEKHTNAINATCICSGRQLEETVEKNVQMQPFATLHLFRQTI